MTRIHLVRAAAPILLQDRGRRGYADLGVPTSGAFDRGAAALAQRLVGNPESSAGLEVTFGGAWLRTETTVTVVVTGAEAEVRVAGRGVAVNEVVSWPAGSLLHIGAPATGLRNYVAVRGGFAVSPVLGSAATDILSGLGPPPLRTGDTVALAHADAALPAVSHAPSLAREGAALRIRFGPRSDWFHPSARQCLLGSEYEVTTHSNRVGLRLHGPALLRARAGELPSEPLQFGALQVPPNGQPIIMGPDHPTTGGYPVIAAIIHADWDLLAQLRPGDRVRFASGA